MLAITPALGMLRQKRQKELKLELKANLGNIMRPTVKKTTNFCFCILLLFLFLVMLEFELSLALVRQALYYLRHTISPFHFGYFSDSVTQFLPGADLKP